MHTRRGCESAARVLSRGNVAAELARVFATPLPDRVGAPLADRFSTPRSCNPRALTLHLFLFAVCAERAPARRGPRTACDASSRWRASRRGARRALRVGVLAQSRCVRRRQAALLAALWCLLTLGRLEPLLTPPFSSLAARVVADGGGGGAQQQDEQQQHATARTARGRWRISQRRERRARGGGRR